LTKKYNGAIALTTLAFLVGGCHKQTAASVSGNLGTVDGEPISYSEFYSYLERKPTVLVTSQGRAVKVQVSETLGFQAVQDLIQQKLLLEVAKDEGVLPSKDDIDKELALRKRQNSNYIDSLLHAGLTTDDIRNEILLSLARERIASKGVTVSTSEAKSFIAQHKENFSIPAEANLLYIVVNSAAQKAAADNDLKSGQNFGAVAMVYSKATNARSSGGAFPENNISRFPPLLKTLIAETPENKSTSWQKDGQNWVKFYVKSKSAAKPMPMTGDMVTMVQRSLAQQKNPSNDRDFQKKMLQKIKSAKIELSSPFYRDGWTNYATQLASAQVGQ
jgi:parvulin-like peptidyl-prolyl isomerase